MRPGIRLDDLVRTLVSPRRRIQDPRLARHQIEGADAILAMLDRFGGAVLADDVGLGKSYIAAAVARHLQKRGIQSEFVVPASLVSQWREVLQLFGLRDTLVYSHDSAHTRNVMPVAAPARLVVVDEAHRFRNPETRRYDALARLVVGNQVLLVTATPICNSRLDLSALLRIAFPDDAFRSVGVLSIEAAFRSNDVRQMRSVVASILVRRGREVLPEDLDFGELTRKVIRHDTYDAHGEIPKLFAAMQFPMIARGSERRMLRTFLWRRLESSEAACVDSLKRQRRFYRRARESMLEGCRLTKDDFRTLFGDGDEETPFQDLLFRDLWMPRSESADLRAIDEEADLIDRALRFLAVAGESKICQLVTVLHDERPTIVFTASIATAAAIEERLRHLARAALVTSRTCRLGGLRCERESALAEFASGRVAVLVATDLAAEGLNLQVASRIVHFDLPWNPVKLDQRNGRAFRIGQRSEGVEALYFVPSRTADRARIVATVTEKNRRRRALLRNDPFAGSVPGDEIDERRFLCCPETDARLWVIRSADMPLLLLEREGRLIEDRDEIAAFVRDHVECVAAPHAAEVEISDLLRTLELRIASRRELPPLVPAASSQVRLRDRLRAFCTDALAAALAKSYTTGVETMLGEVATEFIDGDRASFVADALAREASLRVRVPVIDIVAVIDFGSFAAGAEAVYRADWKTAAPVVSSRVDA